MIRAILIISFFITGWQTQAKDIKEVASHSVNREFIKIQNETNPAQSVCIINTKETGKVKFISRIYEEAFSKVIESCFQRQIWFFMESLKKHPTQDEQIRFARACTSNVRCL